MNSRGYLAFVAALALFAVPVLAKEEPAKIPLGPRPKLSIAAMEHDFGKLKPGTPLEYRFEFKNEGQGNLVIQKVKAACGCTTTKYDSLVAPGKTGSISLAVKKTDTYKGAISKYATVTTNDPERATFQLTLRATFEGTK